MMFWPDGDVSGWGWAAMTISMVLFWGLLVLGGVLLLRAFGSPLAKPPPARPSAQDVLAERFARGEIDEEEFRRRVAALADSRHITPLP